MAETSKHRFRFSLRAALAAMLVVCLGLGLMRFTVQNPTVLIVAVGLIVCSGSALLAYAAGRDPTDGIVWGVLILAALLFIGMLTPAVSYLASLFLQA